MGATPPDDAIASALFGRARRAILALLCTRPEETFYSRQIVRAVGAGQGGVQRELTRLTKAGILRRSSRGRHVEYRANPECPVFEELRSLMVKTAGVADVVKSALAPLSERIRAAIVHGSFAHGRPRASSDIDLLIVGPVTFEQVSDALNEAERALGREINASVYRPDEFARRLTEKHPFLRAVLREPKIFLIGSERELARLAERRLVARTRAHGS